MLKLDIQMFGGRGASSSSNMFSTNIPKNMKIQLGKALYGGGLSNETYTRYFDKELKQLADGTPLNDYAGWEVNKSNGMWTKAGIKNRITYATKGYQAAKEEGARFAKQYANRKNK